VAIKGKTKRSQGRPVRRVTPGPRAVAAERRAPWYRAPAFLATLGIVALLVTLIVAVDRTQYGWARDDVARFISALNGPMTKVTGIAGSGVDGQPGFSSVAEFATGKVKADEVVKRAQTWQQQLTAVREQVNGITVGEAEADPPNGLPAHSVGGRVRELSAIRDAYLTGIGFYDEAARAWQQAGEVMTTADAAAKGKKDDAATKAAEAQRDQLISAAQGFAQKGQQAVDVAAALLADASARFDLPLSVRMPGESAGSFGARYVDPELDTGGGTAPQQQAPAVPPVSVPTDSVPTDSVPTDSVPATVAPPASS
jgi:hypothetical protein